MRRMRRRLQCLVVAIVLSLGLWSHWYVGNVDLNPVPEGVISPDRRRAVAWATMITDDQYLLGAIVTVRSILNTKTRANKVICMVTNKVSSKVQKVLRMAGCTVRWVSSIASPDDRGTSRYTDTYTKLNVWDLTEFDAVLFVDADVLVLSNVDELFSLHLPSAKHVAAARDCCDMWNPGVMVLQPDAEVFQDMLRRMRDLPSWDGGDGGFLNSYFVDRCTYLSYRYNADQIVLSLPRNRRAWRVEDLAIIHFAGPKPWDHLANASGAAARSGEVQGLSHNLFHDLHVLWERHFTQLQEQTPELIRAYKEMSGAA
eukprot:EG_transcript_19202